MKLFGDSREMQLAINAIIICREYTAAAYTKEAERAQLKVKNDFSQFAAGSSEISAIFSGKISAVKKSFFKIY